MDYYPIVGYGLALRESEMDRVFDKGKFRTDPDEWGWEGCLDAVLSGTSLYWCSTGEMWKDRVYYVYLPAVMPWGREHEVTEQDVKQEILDVFAPYVKVDPREILERIGDVWDVGCG